MVERLPAVTPLQAVEQGILLQHREFNPYGHQHCRDHDKQAQCGADNFEKHLVEIIHSGCGSVCRFLEGCALRDEHRRVLEVVQVQAAAVQEFDGLCGHEADGRGLAHAVCVRAGNVEVREDGVAVRDWSV